MRLLTLISALWLCLLSVSPGYSQNTTNVINLAGTWHFRMDPGNQGIQNKWYEKKLNNTIHLPGSMVQNGKGNPVTINTNWTGSIYDSSFYFDPRLAKYRKPDHPMFSFFLTPKKHYVGAAWYQKEVTIPQSWNDRHIQLFLERAHWETQVWADGTEIGTANSLSTPHVYDLSKVLTPGRHRITIRVDNSIKDVGINVGPDSHSLTDQTQGNWNGIIGRMELISRSQVWLSDIQVYPDIRHRTAEVKIRIKKSLTGHVNGNITISAQ
ncbi:MAG TPA: hypothetical protein VKA08_07900, partial [Balneolales bacterium]|nr:hypothetical protein [Balneolales bacterium]